MFLDEVEEIIATNTIGSLTPLVLQKYSFKSYKSEQNIKRSKGGIS